VSESSEVVVVAASECRRWRCVQLAHTCSTWYRVEELAVSEVLEVAASAEAERL
jgi:hypothetical protein